jgi:hypothetical protein
MTRSERQGSTGLSDKVGPCLPLSDALGWDHHRVCVAAAQARGMKLAMGARELLASKGQDVGVSRT